MDTAARIGIVPYLNVKPVVYPLLTGEIKHNFTIIKDPPANLARALSRKELDIAFIPAIEYARGDNYRIIPEIAISSMGSVKSVLLYSKEQPSKITSVALDESSRTSAALVKILLPYCFGVRPKYSTLPPKLNAMLSCADAALLIGDQALLVPRNGYHCIDLGALWQAYTGLGFVFAFFVVRAGFNADEAVSIMCESKKRGLKQIPEIARCEAAKLGLPVKVCLDYLSRRIHYDLGKKELEALKRFYKLAGKEELISKEVSLKFYH